MGRIMDSLRSVPWHTWLLIAAGLLGLYLTWRLFRNSQGGASSVATNPNWAGLGAGQTPQGDMLLSSIQGLQQSLAALQSQPAASSPSGSTPKTITKTITQVVTRVVGGGSSSGGYASSSTVKAPVTSTAHATASHANPTPASTTSHLPHAIPYTHSAYSVPASDTHVVTPPVLAHGFIQY